MALGALLTATVMMGTSVHAGSPIRIAAEVTRPENNPAPVMITVTNSSGDTLWTRTLRAARFAVQLPGNEPYTVSFEQANCVRKEVVIDTRHALRPGARTKVRRVTFEVVLDIDPNADTRYAGPVGHIDFHKGSGRMQIRRDYALLSGKTR